MSPPEDLLHFVELRPFSRAWTKLGLGVDDLFALQTCIMCDPRKAPVIARTGGLRKLRFAPPGWNVGKRGALRICYVFFESVRIVLLVLVYTKAEKDDLSGAERESLRQLIAEIEEEHCR